MQPGIRRPAFSFTTNTHTSSFFFSSLLARTNSHQPSTPSLYRHHQYTLLCPRRQMTTQRTKTSLIVGLGNLIHPNTRHSVGIAFVERLARRLDMKFVRDKTVMGLVASREGLVLVQPTTLMNLNGKTVLRAMRKFQVDPEDVTVVHDDVETAVGKITVRMGGGARGHNGIRSTMNCLGTDQFRRVRVGVGRPSNQTAALADYVLAKFPREEQHMIDEVTDKTLDDLLATILPSTAEAKG